MEKPGVLQYMGVTKSQTWLNNSSRRIWNPVQHIGM